MARSSWAAVTAIGSILAASCAGAEASGVRSEPSQTSREARVAEADLIRRTLIALDAMSEAEREDLLPWLVQTIARQGDAHLEGQLSEALDEKLAQLAGAEASGALTDERLLPLGEEVGLSGDARERFEALLQREQQALPSAEDIRTQIDALVLDPERPGVALGHAMEIAGVIDHIEDPHLQTSLMRYLEDKLAALQATL
ncbi:MAG: hypothetical protein HYT90_05700 [Candidatus Omnitrophica bacterium]|nr:hypothetical protein [Candidatus Omnitrophota bacterium]